MSIYFQFWKPNKKLIISAVKITNSTMSQSPSEPREQPLPIPPAFGPNVPITFHCEMCGLNLPLNQFCILPDQTHHPLCSECNNAVRIGGIQKSLENSELEGGPKPLDVYTCGVCGETKPNHDYYADRVTKNLRKYENTCKVCRNIARRTRRQQLKAVKTTIDDDIVDVAVDHDDDDDLIEY